MKWKKLQQIRCLGLLVLLIYAGPLLSQIEMDVEVAVGDSISRFWIQIPGLYDSTRPPALLVGWHQWGGDEHELRDYTGFDEECNLRGWLCASHFGWCDRHWNDPMAQDYVIAMLDWIRDNYPFDEDSLYFTGGSMGGAAGMVYHNNHCDSREFIIAATASGSGIMDCHRRGMEYLAQGDTNQSMRMVFGGLPYEAPFEYQRNSAVFFADTSYSMHFNSRHLPVLLTFGLNEDPWKSHALDLDSVRDGWADTTYTYESVDFGHGIQIMWPVHICNWLSGFRANRYPDEISINADETGRYYWVTVAPTSSDTTFARFEACKNLAENRVDLTAIRHVALLEFDGEELGLDLAELIVGQWMNLGDGIMDVALTGLTAAPDSVTMNGGHITNWNYSQAEQRLVIPVGRGGLFRIYPNTSGIGNLLQSLVVETQVLGNFPNPFNSATSFLLEQSKAGQTTLVVYNLLGQEVWRWSGWLPAGTHRVAFDGDGLASGIYLYRLEFPIKSSIKRMVLIR